MKTNVTTIILILSLAAAGCKKIDEKVENYDLFGLEQAQEGIQMQEDKIKKAREYQKYFKDDPSSNQDSTNILNF